MKLSTLFILTLIVFSFSGCKKYEGTGGLASIRGKIIVREYNQSYTQLLDEYYAMEEDVYIVYGENDVYNDRFKTNYDGSFEFNYLVKGNYSIFVYTEDTTFSIPGGKFPIFQEVEITDKKEIIDVGEIIIIKS